jgi:Ca-activated chloride channel family protein
MFNKIRKIYRFLNSDNDDSQASMLQGTKGEKIALQSVSVEGQLDGLLLGTTIRQNYHNNTGKNLEIVYTFPVAFDTTLLGMSVVIGDKRLQGVVIEKKQAEKEYEKALEEGDTPIMVQESSPGLYTANLGNIKAKENVSIEIQCSQLLRFEQGQIRVKIPTTIAPRYGDSYKEGGLSRHETAAVDLSASYPLTVRLNVHGESAKANISCPSHTVIIWHEEDSVSVLLESGAMLDRDFILLLQNLSGHSFALASPDGEQHAMLASFCPKLPVKADPVLLKILVDCSGSMAVNSIFQAKKALKAIVQELKPNDYVSYSRFGSGVEHQNKRMQACSLEVLRQLVNRVAATEADMGGTEMESALASTFRDVAVPDGNHNRPCVLFITDDLVWNNKGILRTCLDSGHRIFAIGVGSAPAESLLREITGKTGGACEFVSPNEDISAAIIRMFHRMRLARTNSLKIDWGTEPVWQSPLPLAVFDDETVHLFATFAEAPVVPPKLSWEVDGKTEYAMPESISAGENQDVVRLTANRRMETSDRKKALDIALKYQLVSDQTSLFLVYLRENEDKVTELPEVHQVPQMMAFGSHGYGSTSTKQRLLSCQPECPDSIASTRISTQSCSLIQAYQKLLESFDSAALDNQSFSDFVKSTFPQTEHHETGVLVERLSKQEGISVEDVWAVLLDWLMDQLVDVFTPTRQARRLLKAQIRHIDRKRVVVLRKALAVELPSPGLSGEAAVHW